MSNPDRKSHWQFLANLLGAESNAAPESETKESQEPQQAERVESVVETETPKAEVPGPSNSVKKPAAPVSKASPKSKSRGWGDVAKALGLQADDTGEATSDEKSPGKTTEAAPVMAKSSPDPISEKLTENPVDDITSIFHAGSKTSSAKSRSNDPLKTLFSVEDAKPPEPRKVRQVDDVGDEDEGFLDEVGDFAADDGDQEARSPRSDSRARRPEVRERDSGEENVEGTGERKKRRRRRSGRRRKKKEDGIAGEASPSDVLETRESDEVDDDLMLDVSETAAEFADSLDVTDEEGIAREGRRTRRRRSRRRGSPEAEGSRPPRSRGRDDVAAKSPAAASEVDGVDEEDSDDERPVRAPSSRGPREMRERQPRESRERSARGPRRQRREPTSEEMAPRRRPAPVDHKVENADVDLDDDSDIDLDIDLEVESDSSGRRKVRRNIPTWSDAVEEIVSGNIAQRANRSRAPQRGRGGRGDQRRPPRRRD